MTERDSEANEGTLRRAERMPYRPPAVVESAVFETLALACAKASTTDPNCLTGMLTTS